MDGSDLKVSDSSGSDRNPLRLPSERLLRRIEDFNQPLNNWNVSNVEDMENMFQNARSFNQPLHAPWYHEDSESE